MPHGWLRGAVPSSTGWRHCRAPSIAPVDARLDTCPNRNVANVPNRDRQLQRRRTPPPLASASSATTSPCNAHLRRVATWVPASTALSAGWQWKHAARCAARRPLHCASSEHCPRAAKHARRCDRAHCMRGACMLPPCRTCSDHWPLGWSHVPVCSLFPN